MFDATENFWILPNFIFRMSPVVKNVSFELNFWHESKCWLCKMSSLAGQEWSNSLFQAKFSTRLKISGFCQISSFAGLEWSKIYFLSQIFNTNQNFSRFCQISSFVGSEWSTLSFFSQICSVTENFWILPNFILCMSRVVKTLNFGLDFDCDWKFLNFTTFHPLHVQSGQKCQLGWAKFLIRIKISWFCKISSFAGQEWSKSRLQAEFSMRLKISGFCHISSFAGLEWSKIWFLSQIFNTNQNFPRFCQISSFLVFYVVKNVSFELFSTVIKISGFSQISSFAGPEWSNSQFKPNFHRDWKLLNFAKLHPSHVLSGQKCQFWAKFSTWLKYVSILPNLSLPRSRVVKNVNFDPNLKRNWNFLDFAKFHPLQAEWSKMSILSQIFNLTQNVCILPNFSLSRSRVVRNVNFDPNFNWD